MFNLSISKSDPALVVIAEGTITVAPMNDGRNPFILKLSTADSSAVGIRNPIPAKALGSVAFNFLIISSSVIPGNNLRDSSGKEINISHQGSFFV